MNFDSHIGNRRHNRFGDRIGYSAFQVYLDKRCFRQSGRRAAPADIILFADRIGQKLSRQTLGKILVEVRLDKKDLRRLNHLHRIDAQLLNVFQYAFALNIRKTRTIKDLNTPLLHDIISFFLIL